MKVPFLKVAGINKAIEDLRSFYEKFKKHIPCLKTFDLNCHVPINKVMISAHNAPSLNPSRPA
jgi:hypothetical protein